MKAWHKIYYISILFSVMVCQTYYCGGLSYYYTHTLGMSLETQAVLWSIFVPISIVGLIICGSISDRYSDKNNRGRRIPLLRLFGLIEGLAFALMFIIPFSGSHPLLLILVYMVGMIIIDFSDNFVSSSIFAIPSEEITDCNARSSIYIKTGIVSALALSLQSIIVPNIQVDIGEDPTVFRLVMLCMGLGLALITCLGSYKLPCKYRPDMDLIKSSNPIHSYLACLKNRTFMIGEIYLTMMVATSCIGLFGIYYYIDEVNHIRLWMYIFAPIGACIAYFGHKLLQHIMYSKYIYVLYSLAACLGFALTYILGNSLLAPIPLLIAGGITAFIQYSFNSIIIVDAVDRDEKLSGIRKEAQYFSLDYLFDALGSYSTTVFLLIIMAHGYREGIPSGMQNSTARLGISIGYLILPSILLLVATVSMLFYPRDKS